MPVKTITLKLKSGKNAKGEHSLKVISPYEEFTPEYAIIDAINQYFGSSEADWSKKYDRISFTYYDGKIIHLTNPKFTNANTRPYYDASRDPDSNSFAAAYYPKDDGKKPKPTPEPAKPPSDPSLPFLSDPSWYPNDPSKVAGKYQQLPPDLTSKQWKPITQDFYSGGADNWQSRWDDAMKLSREIQHQDNIRGIERARRFDAINTEYANNVTDMSENILNWPQAIFKILINAFRAIFTFWSYIPEELWAAAQRFQLNVTIIHLSIERLFNIMTGLFDLVTKIYQRSAALDWEGAIKLANKLIADEKTSLDKAKELGVLDDDYNPQGLEHWQVPISPVNTDTEFAQYEALSALAHSPLFGTHLQAQMQMQLAKDYQLATGVGFPNANAWYKFILNNQIGTTVPIQEASDMAGQVPDWFVARATDYQKHIAPVIHQQQHTETKHMKR